MAGFYATEIFPRLMDWTMRTPRFQEQRRLTLAELHGSVLEIGFGTGLNLPHLPKTVTWLTAVEPENLLPKSVSRRSVDAPVPVEVIRVSAEQLPFEDGRFDCVLSTWTLCSIQDVAAALREVRRVLKTTGILRFLEHGCSDDQQVAKWQDRLNPFQRVLACGCNVNRPIDTLIEDAGFKIAGLERYEMLGVPRFLGQMYRGSASPMKR